MLILTETTDKIQAVLGGTVTTNQLQCMSSWRDITTTVYTPGRTIINTNNTTDIDLVGSPGSSTQRVVDYISIYNKDTANATVTIKFDANGTEYILFVATISAGEKIEYQEGLGFKVIANSGAVKNSINQGNNTIGTSLTAVVLGTDVVNNNAVANTMRDVTGLSFSVTANHTYYFHATIFYTAAATSTGSRWSINGPAAVATWTSEYSLAATTTTRNANVLTYDLPAACNATSAAVDKNQADLMGIIKPTADGTVIVRFASEVAGSAITAKAGSVLYYQQTL
jgi:hypothetical protein